MRRFLHIALCAALAASFTAPALAAGPVGMDMRRDAPAGTPGASVSMERDMRATRQVEAKPQQANPATPDPAVPYSYPEVHPEGARTLPSAGGADPGIFRYGPPRDDRPNTIIREDPPPRFRR